MLDDHYIPNPNNAHIRTEGFQTRMREGPSFAARENQAFTKEVYAAIENRLANPPEAAPRDALICRYLSVSKFVDLISLKELYIPDATRFQDAWDCRVPEDYDVATRTLLYEMGIKDAKEWVELQHRMAAEWNVSCWTELRDHFDDSLMWQAYAGGPSGIGVTIRYAILFEFLRGSGLAEHFYGGRVSYQSLKLMPFNKHPIFRNENEVRFAFRRNNVAGVGMSVDIQEIFDQFGIRLSPPAQRDTSEWSEHSGRLLVVLISKNLQPGSRPEPPVGAH